MPVNMKRFIAKKPMKIVLTGLIIVSALPLIYIAFTPPESTKAA